MNLNLGEGVIFVSSILISVSCLLIGIFVIIKDRKALVNRTWFLLCLSTAIWALGYAEVQLSPDKFTALFWGRYFLYSGAIFIPVFYLHFILSFLNVKRTKLLLASYIFAVILLYLDITTPFLIKDIVPKLQFKYYADPGSLYFLFLLFFASCIFYSFWLMLSYYNKVSVYKRNQLKYILFASVIGFGGGATNYPLIYNIPIFPFGQLLVFFYPLIITYAILKYRLMNITIVVTRTGVFIAVYTLVLGLPFILAVSGRKWLAESLGASWWIAPLSLMAVLATAGPFVYIFLQKRAEAMFLREQQEYQRVLRKAANEITRIHKMDKLLDLITNLFVNPVKVARFGMYLFDKASACFLLKSNYNLKKEQPSSISGENVLIEWLRREKEIMVYEEVKRKAQEMPGPVFEELAKQMRNLDASILIPCFLDNELTIIISLGDKLSKRVYTVEDLNAFSILAGQIALAIKDASLYESMEEQVRQRTKELVKVQKQLIQTEKLATIGTLAGGVAHEINNPLAAILMNAQMLIASGKIQDEDDKEALELIEESVKRCQNIVQKLMSYARKPSKKDVASTLKLDAVVKKAVSFLEYQLKQDNIDIVTDIDDDAHLILGNANELEQVVTNIVLNAKDAVKKIKKSGKIYISVHRDNKWVDLRIKDEGIGIGRKTLSKIFDPFFTTKDVGKGLGLGLSICQAIIKRHNGTINVQSELGKGTTFIIKFPCVDGKDTSLAQT